MGICLVSILLLAAGTSCLPAGPGPESVPLAFRYDDFSAKSDTALEQAIFDLFERCGVPLTVAVIPAVCEGPFEQTGPQILLPLPEAKSAMLRQRLAGGTIEIAQHGYTHQAQTPGAADPSEFLGLTYQDQSTRIATGKALLEQAFGQTIHMFVPPWDRYDSNTVTALQDLGFTCLSAGPTGPEPADARIRFVPATCYLTDVEHKVNSARLVWDRRPIVVLFHPQDFRESNPTDGKVGLADLERLLVWARSESMLQLATVGQIAAEPDIHAQRTNP
jgi:peptidoglycan/xylan/chitin deacetylase (PgdA/CDA1 family)